MPFSAVLDACVLYPNVLRDTLLRIAQAGSYQPLWSTRILDEVHRNLMKSGGLTQDRADYVIDQMAKAFHPEALVQGWEDLEAAMTNDPKDRHVLAAAVRGHADVIVTSNFKDFPESSLDGYDIGVQEPDVFLCYELEQSPELVKWALHVQAAATGKGGRPKWTVADVIAGLDRCGATTFARQARTWLAEP